MRKRSFLPLCIAAILTVPPVMPAYGAVGPGQTGNPIPDGVTEEQWNRLNDQSIEFNELPDLVRYFNPDMQNTVDTIQNSIGKVKYIQDEMKGYIRDLESESEDLKDSGAANSGEGMQQYIILNMTVKGLKSSSEGLGRTLDYMNRPNSLVNSNITYAAKNYTFYANQIMTGYNSALASRVLLQKVSEISQAAYESQKMSRQLGMATEEDVLSAHKEVLSARSSLLKIENTIDSLRRSLCLITGYSPDSETVIGTVPQLDSSVLSTMDLETDTAKAIGNNYSLISTRRTASNQTTTGITNKEDRVTEGEQSVAVTMESYYQEVMQAKSAYEAACIAYERASLEKEKADRSIQSGMLSKISYLQAHMRFLQVESEKQSSYITLYQAYDTYQWAISGIIIAQ